MNGQKHAAAEGLGDRFAMVIAGERSKGSDTFEVINPATGLPFAESPRASREEVDAAMTGAQNAYRSWHRNEDLRVSSMLRAAEVLEANQEELATILTLEQGKPLRDSRAEVSTSVRWLRWYADATLAPETIEDSAERRIVLNRRSLGPVVAITPWNFPIQMVGKKAAQALRVGNTVVVKPASYTPLATLRMIELLQEAFPPGVLSAVAGGSQVGDWLTTHPLTRKISFTGSTPVGKHIAGVAADDLKRVTLELGGNDAAIVLDDADPEVVAAGIFDRAMLNCGQTCAAIKRVYVPSSLYENIVGALAAIAESAVVGDGMDEKTQYGPVNNADQLALVKDLVDDAVKRGGRLMTGGSRLEGNGYFYTPAIVTNVTDGVRLVDEEQFGPALPVTPYSSLEDAIDRANNSKYGLGASVWTSDPERGQNVARELEVGTAWINTHAVTLPNQPFAGAKWSGIGVENGVLGMHEFTQVQAIHTVR